MTIYLHRARANANASLISMVQRFSDIFIIFLGLYIVCFFNNVIFSYKEVLLYLSILVTFQMIGGITDFIALGEGLEYR